MNSSPNWILAVAGVLGLLGVALGAFGAHALKETLETHATTDIWRTAVLYQLVHAVALLALATGRLGALPGVTSVGGCWLAGVVLFSGSLYGLALGGPKFLGPVTPVGGLCFLVGWALIIRLAWVARAS
jgi:uncharacterized membrane protein YgdD (TMEM256/DUF423 family)